MIREILAPRAFFIFLVLWALVTWGVLYWNRASKSKHRTWLRRAFLPAVSGAIAMVVVLVLMFVLQP